MKFIWVIAILFLSLILRTSSEERQTDAQDRIESLLRPPDKLVLQKSHPYVKRSPRDDSSFLSKLTSWLNPFGGGGKDDSVPQEVHYSPPRYLPPPIPLKYNHDQNPQPCNPCNKEPWIPVAASYGKNTIIGFVQPSELGPPPSVDSHFQTHQHYGPPQSHIPNQEYGPPPASQDYGPPKQYFEFVPPNQNFGPPPTNQQYGPPKQYLGPPPANQEYGPPSKQYLPSQHHGPPFRPQEYGPPKQNPHEYGPPRQFIGVPHLVNEVPKQLGQEYGPPKEHVNFPPNQQYGAPKHIPIHDQHGLPSVVSPPNYRLPPVPRDHVMPPPYFDGRQRPHSQQGKFEPPRFKPKQNAKFLNKHATPSDMRPPPLNGFITNYGVPLPINTNHLPPIGHNQTPPSNLQTLPSVVPSDSYGVPVTGSDVNYGLSSSFNKGQQYLPPLDDLGILSNSNSDIQVSQSIPLTLFDEILEIPQGPIALPNLNHFPLAPIHNAQEFRNVDTTVPPVPHSNHHNEGESVHSIQIVPSVPVASFLSSIEHPINLIQSPLVDLTTSDVGSSVDSLDLVEKVKLSEKPIVVPNNGGDNDASATAQNATYHDNEEKSLAETLAPNPEFVDQFLENATVTGDFQTHTSTEFAPPTLDYSDWSPSINTISTSMLPPPIGESVWLSTADGVGEQIIETTTTKPTKQIQIIIPYTTINKPTPFDGTLTTKPDLIRTQGRKVPSYSGDFEPKLSLYTQPPSGESVWSDYNTDESKEVVAKTVINIKDLLKMETDKKYYQNLPYDIITLQKNIDGWTEQEFSKKVNRGLVQYEKASTIAQLVPSKKIPAAYLTTTTPKYSYDFYDHEPAGSNSKESKFQELNNFILTDVTTIPSTTEEVTTTEIPSTTTRSTWDNRQVAFSPLTREKVYVVTPETWQRITTTPPTLTAFSHPPKIGTNSPSFAISLKPGQSAKTDDLDDSVRIIFSEWPHLINKLATTTTTTTTRKPSTRHPLFGFMDLSSYIPPVNSTIQTYSGHSKVITIVTPSSVSTKKEIDNELGNKKVF